MAPAWQAGGRAAAGGRRESGCQVAAGAGARGAERGSGAVPCTVHRTSWLAHSIPRRPLLQRPARSPAPTPPPTPAAAPPPSTNLTTPPPHRCRLRTALLVAALGEPVAPQSHRQLLVGPEACHHARRCLQRVGEDVGQQPGSSNSHWRQHAGRSGSSTPRHPSTHTTATPRPTHSGAQQHHTQANAHTTC